MPRIARRHPEGSESSVSFGLKNRFGKSHGLGCRAFSARIEPETTSMTTIAEGKDEVLAYLERESENIAGQPGVYRLVKDDAGNLVALIAGRSFLGTGSYALAGSRMVVVDGLVVNMQPPS